MSDLITRTARLVPYAKRPKHIASFVTAYAYEPEADEPGAPLGNLYVVVEALVSGRASEEVVDLVIQSVGDTYYNEQGDERNPLTRFEAAIKQTNHELSEYVGRGNAAWIGKLSAIIAVQADSELHVAQTGSAEAFLYRGKAVSRISQSETARPATPSKTFGSIATGELETGDKLLIATPALIHQIPLAKLQSVISATSPNGSIQEISQLLEGAITTRVAAIVAEITTPELAALKVRSDQPAEIELGNGENFAEAAMSAAAPLAHSTAQTSRKAAKAALGSWQQIKPVLKKQSLAAVDLLRRALSTSQSRRISLAFVVIIVVALIATSLQSGKQATASRQFSQYQKLFSQYIAARDTAPSGKTGARQSLITIQKSITGLGASESGINQSLKNHPLAEGEPTSVSSFKELVANQIDKIDGLIKLSPMTVAEIGGKTGRPVHFESDGARAYVIDAANHNAISIVDLQTGTQKDSTANFSKLGDVVNTTISSTNDGMFILTATPAVWFYKFANDSLAPQTLAYGEWPKSHSIASYGPNLYLLGDSAVYKHVRNATGYSPKSDYISTTSLAGPATAMAVDGWVYLMSGSGLSRYLASSLKQTAATPSTLGNITNLRSVADGDYIFGTSQSSNRIAIWTSKSDNLAFYKQIALTDSPSLTDATYDQKLGKGFALVGNRLVSFPLKP